LDRIEIRRARDQAEIVDATSRGQPDAPRRASGRYHETSRLHRTTTSFGIIGDLDLPAIVGAIDAFGRTARDVDALLPEPTAEPYIEPGPIDVPCGPRGMQGEHCPLGLGAIPGRGHDRTRPGQVERHVLPEVFVLEDRSPLGRHDLGSYDPPRLLAIDDEHTGAGAGEPERGLGTGGSSSGNDNGVVHLERRTR